MRPLSSVNKIQEKHIRVFLLVLGLLYGTVIGELNLATSNARLQSSITVSSIDTEYYVTPVESFILTGSWCRSPSLGEGDFVRRTPSYGLWYLPFRAVLGPEKGQYVVRTAQVILFALSILLLYLIFGLVGLNRFSQLLLTLMYALIPTYSHWAYYLLTESISIPLCILSLYYLLRGALQQGRKQRIFTLATLVAVSAMLVRPFCGVFLLAYFWRCCSNTSSIVRQ
jgi:4-amino-4-deoxy-L-arabinose transferase-like glycosyltransferase